MYPATYSGEAVQSLQSYFQDHRGPRAPKRRQDEEIALAVARALRGYMARVGPVKVNPDLTDEYEEVEREMKPRPIHGTAKLRILGQWYLHDSAIIREALELGKSKGSRSSEAGWLESALQQNELDGYAVFRAKPKLLSIYRQLQPI